MRRWRSSGAGILLVALAGFSCKPAAGPNDGDSPSSIVFPLSNVSYKLHVQPLFNQTCTLVGCHDDASTQRLKLTSWGGTRLSLAGVVIEGHPESSTLVLRIQGSVGTLMPPNSNPLNQNQINGIRAWITEGARDN